MQSLAIAQTTKATKDYRCALGNAVAWGLLSSSTGSDLLQGSAGDLQATAAQL